MAKEPHGAAQPLGPAGPLGQWARHFGAVVALAIVIGLCPGVGLAAVVYNFVNQGSAGLVDIVTFDIRHSAHLLFSATLQEQFCGSLRSRGFAVWSWLR